MVRQMLAGASARFGNWVKDKSGAVTTDWVVLVAFLVTLSVLVMMSISGSVEILADKTGTELGNRQPGQL